MSGSPAPDSGKLAPLPDHEGPDTDRIVFFSDAIFAIAMTVIAVSLDIPHIDVRNGGDEILDILREEWPMYLAYILSFWVIGNYWVGHFRFFRRVARWDYGLVMRNTLLLFLVGFVPHPTRLVGEYGAEESAVIIYAATLAAVGLVWWDLRRHTISRNLMKSEADARLAAKAQLSLFLVPVIFLVSVLVAFWNPGVAMASWALLAVMPYVLVRVRSDAAERAGTTVSEAA